MRQEDHFRAYEQHRATIFRWGVDIQGLENSQRIVGLPIPRMVWLELLSETLSYGTQRPLDATEKALELFSEIENMLLEMIGDE